MSMTGKGRLGGLVRDSRGSLTVEALLIVPLLLVLMVLLLRFGVNLQVANQEVFDSLEPATETGEGSGAAGFLWGGPPARRIRDADLVIDLGRSVKELLPSWVP
jgi:hypothetical protein